MGCFDKAANKDAKQLRFLLGPIKNISASEMKVYNQAALFKYKTDALTNGETAPKEEKDDQPGTNREDVIHNEIIQNGFLGEKTGPTSVLFVPLECTAKSLRVQQTFNMWKAPLDIGWKFRRMKKRRTISLQPLDTFPEFVHEFRFKTQEISFFTFLKEFTRIYFHGFDVDVLESVDMAKAKWNITTR